MTDPSPSASRTESTPRLLTKLLSATVTLLVLVGVINFVVNPYSYYPTRLFPSIGWHSRRLKVEMLESRPRAPEALILGSSRTMKVAPSDVRRLTGLDAFNACVDSARAEDWEVMYRYVTEALGARVREVIIGVDVEAFHNHKDADPRLLATYQLRPFVPLALKWAWYLHAARESISWIQLMESVNSLRYRLHGYPPGKYRFDPDGVLHYVEWEKQIAAGTFKWDASLDEYDSRLEGMTGLSEWRRQFFDELLRLAQQRGATVRVFVTPLHAVTLEHLRQTRDYDRLRAETVEYLQGEARRYRNLKVVDFTEVKAFGGREDGFLDGAHTTDENSALMIKALWNQTSSDSN